MTKKDFLATLPFPTPTDDEVARFAKLYAEHFGVELTPGQARSALTPLLRIHFIVVRNGGWRDPAEARRKGLRDLP